MAARISFGANDGDRTRDNRYHKPALYQLSYVRHQVFVGGASYRCQAVAVNFLAPGRSHAAIRCNAVCSTAGCLQKAKRTYRVGGSAA